MKANYKSDQLYCSHMLSAALLLKSRDKKATTVLSSITEWIKKHVFVKEIEDKLY